MIRICQVVVAAAIGLGVNAAVAQLAPAPDAAEPSAASPQALRTPAQPPQRKLAPRRATRQIVGAPLPIVLDGYRPSLYPPPTASGLPDPVGTLQIHPSAPGVQAPAGVAPLPVPLTGCTGTSCMGADGVRYNGGVGKVTVDPSGRSCHLVAGTVECF